MSSRHGSRKHPEAIIEARRRDEDFRNAIQSNINAEAKMRSFAQWFVLSSILEHF
jgi:hypothetical protein